MANKVSLLLDEDEDCCSFSRRRTLSKASRAEDWMDRPRILKMRAMRFRSDMVDSSLVLMLRLRLVLSG